MSFRQSRARMFAAYTREPSFRRPCKWYDGASPGRYDREVPVAVMMVIQSHHFPSWRCSGALRPEAAVKFVVDADDQLLTVRCTAHCCGIARHCVAILLVRPRPLAISISSIGMMTFHHRIFLMSHHSFLSYTCMHSSSSGMYSQSIRTSFAQSNADFRRSRFCSISSKQPWVVFLMQPVTYTRIQSKDHNLSVVPPQRGGWCEAREIRQTARRSQALSAGVSRLVAV